MSENMNTYQPDYAVPPGWVLEEHLEARGLSKTAFAERCGHSYKMVSQILNGTAPIEPQTALEFERVLGMDASVWLNMEASYRLFLAKEKEQEELKENVEWAKRFPVKDLKKLDIISNSAKDEGLVSDLLSFLGIGSPKVWEVKMEALAPKLQFRKQNNHKLSIESLSVWLRLGEIAAFQQECEPYDRVKFISNLKEIRNLTVLPPQEFYPQMVELCNEAGVSFSVLPQLNELPVSGIARWLAPNKANISLTLRFKTNDHFWFSFFHEAAHLLLHGKKGVFVDLLQTKGTSDEEKEADAWASNFLMPNDLFDDFSKKAKNTKNVSEFAKSINIHTGIVVGRLQHQGLLPWTHLNQLKSRFELVQ